MAHVDVYESGGIGIWDGDARSLMSRIAPEGGGASRSDKMYSIVAAGDVTDEAMGHYDVPSLGQRVRIHVGAGVAFFGE